MRGRAAARGHGTASANLATSAQSGAHGKEDSMKLAWILGAALCLAGCGAAGGKGADGADGADGPKGSLQAGTKVCLHELAGARGPLEDAITAQKLVVDAGCMLYDLGVKEAGSAGAWVMRYQRVGDGDWKECKSSAPDREEFVRKCVEQMIDDLGRPAPVASN
jgi:hypothetical protein